VTLPTPNATEIASTCRVALPTAWKEAIAVGEIKTPASESLVPFAVSGDGRVLFAGDYTSAWSGVVAIQAGTLQRTQIQTFTSTKDQVVGGAFDGRWLVWSEVHSFTNLNDWSLYAWDSVNKRLVNIANVPRVDGQPLPGPLVMPVVSHGELAWSQSVSSEQAELHLFTLATGKDRVVARGRFGIPALAWPWLIWAAPGAPGEPGRFKMVSAETGDPIATPAPLAEVRAPTYVAGAHGTVVWTTADYHHLWLWRAGDAEARELFVSPTDDAIQWPHIGDHLVTWVGTEATYAVDLRTQSVAQITPKYGGAATDGAGLFISYPATTVKSDHPPQKVSFLDANKLPSLPSCGPIGKASP
jgi:hypothetical protein